MTESNGNFGHKDWCSLPNCLGACDCHPEQPDLLGDLQNSIDQARAARRTPPQPGDPIRRCRCADIRRPHYIGDHLPVEPGDPPRST